MAEHWTRNQVRELGLVAMQAGIDSPERLMELIYLGCQAEWRVPLARQGIRDAQLALQGVAD